MRIPQLSQRLRPDPRNAFLVLLAAMAGWIDALSFSRLGEVFTSFQSGNFIFLGLAIDQGDTERLTGAATSLGAFFVGAALGAYVVGRAKVEPSDFRMLLPAFVLEWALLLGFAVYWQALGTPAANSTARLVLLVIGAMAMGTQGGAVFALRIPGVVTNAMTATLMLGGALAGLRARGKRVAEEESPVSVAFLASMCASYVLSALAVGAIGRPELTSAVPAAALALALVGFMVWTGAVRGRSPGRSINSPVPVAGRGR